MHRKLKQAEVADELSVNQSTISNLENAKTPYDQDLLEKLARVYRCEPEDILSCNPLRPDTPRLVYSRLRTAPDDVQRQILAVVEALMNAPKSPHI